MAKKKMSARLAMEAVSEIETWSTMHQLGLALDFIESKKLGGDLFAYLEDKAVSEDNRATDSEE